MDHDIDSAKEADGSKKLSEEINNNYLDEGFDECNVKTTLQEFYSDQCIFITGGTGFLGKILIEKLLRCCPDISRIYILVRPKKNKNVNDRLKDLFNNHIFDRLREKLPEFGKKIIAMPGDCSLPALGLSPQHIQQLVDEVTIVFHAAATVRFDEEIIEATAINIRSTESINDICQRIPKLRSFVHVSTAYANCFSPNIEEKFYDYSIRSQELLDLTKSVSKDILSKISPELMGSWPNTYTFTKALAEDLIRTKSKNLPIGIFRPGIVISTADEPVPGWIDNYYGPTGVVAAIVSGVIRALHCDSKKVANIVPVDLTVNALIASAWDIATQANRRNEQMLIYNFTSTVEAPIQWGKFADSVVKLVDKYPSESALWYTGFTLKKSKLMYWLSIFFLHWIPAALVDFVAVSSGQKPRFKKMYEKMHKFSYVISHFCTNEWVFANNNVQSLWRRLNSQDKLMFRFSMSNFDWDQYLDDYVKGVRIYLLKDDLKTLEASKVKWRRLYWLDKLVQFMLFVIGCWLLWNILSRIFK